MNIHLIIHNSTNDLGDLHKSIETVSKEELKGILLNLECLYLKSKRIYETAKDCLNV